MCKLFSVPPDVLSLLLGEGMSVVLQPFFRAVPGLSFDADRGGGRRLAAGVCAGEVPPALDDNGWEPRLLLRQSHSAAPTSWEESACNRSVLSLTWSHENRLKSTWPTLTMVLAITEQKNLSYGREPAHTQTCYCTRVLLGFRISLPSNTLITAPPHPPKLYKVVRVHTWNTFTRAAIKAIQSNNMVVWKFIWFMVVK